VWFKAINPALTMAKTTAWMTKLVCKPELAMELLL